MDGDAFASCIGNLWDFQWLPNPTQMNSSGHCGGYHHHFCIFVLDSQHIFPNMYWILLWQIQAKSLHSIRVMISAPKYITTFSHWGCIRGMKMEVSMIYKIKLEWRQDDESLLIACMSLVILVITSAVTMCVSQSSNSMRELWKVIDKTKNVMAD